MAKAKERSFLDRALEALGERYKERPTQTRLAKIAGVSQPSVHEWGMADRAPEHRTVLRIARELNVCVEWLYTERGPKRPAEVAETETFLNDWSKLDDTTRRQIAQYTEFLKKAGGSPRQ